MKKKINKIQLLSTFHSLTLKVYVTCIIFPTTSTPLYNKYKLSLKLTSLKKLILSPCTTVHNEKTKKITYNTLTNIKSTHSMR